MRGTVLTEAFERARGLVPAAAEFTVSHDTLTVKAWGEKGFEVSVGRAEGQWIVSVGPWRGHFDDAEEALQCFKGALSLDTYLIVMQRGALAVRTDVHWPSGMVSTTGVLFSPFWRSKSVVTRRNLWPAVQDDRR